MVGKSLRDHLFEIDGSKDWVVYHKDEHIDFELTFIKGFKKPCRLTFSFPIVLSRVVGRAVKSFFGGKINYYSPVHIRNIGWHENDILEGGYWIGETSDIVVEISETAFYIFVRIYFDAMKYEPPQLRSLFTKSVQRAAEGIIVEVASDYEMEFDDEDEESLWAESQMSTPQMSRLAVPDISLDEFISFYPPETKMALERIRNMIDKITEKKRKNLHFSALLAGTPGTGKSLFCALMANYAAERKALVVYLSAHNLADYILETIKMFPCVLFIVDECEPALLNRETSSGKSPVAQIMHLLDGYYLSTSSSSWGLLMTTNRPHVIDPALLRPLRIDEVVEFTPLDDESLAESVFLFWCKKLGVTLPNDWDRKILKGKTHAECAALANKIYRMQEFGKEVDMETIRALVKSVSSWRKPQRLKSQVEEERVGF